MESVAMSDLCDVFVAAKATEIPAHHPGGIRPLPRA